MLPKTFEEVLANRRKWIDFLMRGSRKKATGMLDAGQGNRCCLGHACYALGLRAYEGRDGSLFYENENSQSPDSVVDKLGLHCHLGTVKYPTMDNLSYDGETVSGMSFDNPSFIGKLYASLAEINDETEATPQQIGAYLLTVIEGGLRTPFYNEEEFNKEMAK